MINNYLKIALRNLFKQKSFTFINIVGLAVGMTCFILILLYVRFELSYDNFHTRADRIYRVAIERKYPDKTRYWGRTAFPLAKTFQEEFPEIEQGTRIMNFNIAQLVTYEDKNVYNEHIIFADPNFFEVFSFPLVKGDPKTALAEPNSAVITRESAGVLFGAEEAMYKTLSINNADFTVRGIAENIPPNAHFHFDYILSANTVPAFDGQQWINAWGAFSYIMLQERADAGKVEEKFPEMVKKYMAPEVVDEVKMSFADFVAAGNGYRYFLQPLRDIHLTSSLDQELEANGSITYVRLFSVISIFVLLIACINFMNLTTARSANRAKEVGVRKSVGSTKQHLIGQFLLESVLLSGLALVLAIGLVELLLPAFNSLTARQLGMSYFQNALVLPGLIGLALVVGILAGSYPAFFLSSFRPVTVLKSQLRRGGSSRFLRNSLVVFQFTVSIVLIVSTLVVNRQIDYMVNKDLGFDKEHVVVIRNAGILGPQFQAFKEELKAIPDVINVSGSLNFPGAAFDGNVHVEEGAPDDRATSVSMIFADYDYVRTMGMEIAAGRNFAREFSTDVDAYILNQTAVKMLGLKDPVGARITDHFQVYPVIGVLEDFHFKSLHTKISPLAYRINRNNVVNFISVRIGPGSTSKSLSAFEKKWNAFTESRPFVYTFLDDDLRTQYEAEQKTRQISGIFSFIAIVIGCLGLFGLAAYTAELRTKEIGIRKVLGATLPGITFLLVKEFTRLVLLAFILGVPIAYFGMHDWLQNFAYSIGLSAPPFFAAGMLALSIALITVSFQAFKAAVRDPIDSLRYE